MMTPTNHSFHSVPEVLLMLRAPGAGRLAALLVALEEASRDPDFSARHRAVLARCIDEQSVPVAVAEAARRRCAECNHAHATGTDKRHGACRIAC